MIRTASTRLVSSWTTHRGMLRGANPLATIDNSSSFSTRRSARSKSKKKKKNETHSPKQRVAVPDPLLVTIHRTRQAPTDWNVSLLASSVVSSRPVDWNRDLPVLSNCEPLRIEKDSSAASTANGRSQPYSSKQKRRRRRKKELDREDNPSVTTDTSPVVEASSTQRDTSSETDSVRPWWERQTAAAV